MPPVCCICSKSFSPNKKCGLIYFKKRFSDNEWDKHIEESHMVGHPPYAAWFCEEHYNNAYEMRHLEIDEAMKALLP